MPIDARRGALVRRIADVRRVTVVPVGSPVPGRGAVRSHADGDSRRPRVRPLLHGPLLSSVGEPPVFHPGAHRLRDARGDHPDALTGTGPELAVRYRGGGSTGRTGRRVPGDPPGSRVVERRAGAARRLRGVWRLPAHVGTRVSALRTDPARAHALPPP